jgi:hypothetical protein
MGPEKPFEPKDYLKAFRSFYDAESCNTVQPQSYCVDIHCHSTFMPFNRQGKYPKPPNDQVQTSVNEFWPPPASDDDVRTQRSKTTPTIYQSSFTVLAKSDVRVAFVSLLPLEQGFVHAGKGSDAPPVQVQESADWVGEQLRLSPEAVMVGVKVAEGELGQAVGMVGAELTVKIPMARTEQVQAKTHDYFNDLVAEYKLLANESYWNGDGRPGVPPRAEVKVVGNYDELKLALEEPNITAAIVTAEGGHSLGSGSLKWLAKIGDDELDELDDVKKIGDDVDRTRDELQLDDYLDDVSFANPTSECPMVTRFKSKHVQDLVLQLLKNIKEIKGWGPDGKFAPFFLTFSHHFWNQLCGHAISLPFVQGVLPVFNQNRGIESPMTEVGKVVLRALLSKNNGRRVLIDTKHMSLAGKHWYYRCIKGQNIPIISSHAASSGRELMPPEPTTTDPVQADLNYLVTTRFNSWDINLSDDEIRQIHESNGLVGLNFDERIVAGKLWRYELKNGGQAEWTKPIAEHIYRFAEVIADAPNLTWEDQQKKKVWGLLAIGSDFDGAINPVDGYCWAGDLGDLAVQLTRRLKKMATRSKYPLLQVLQGLPDDPIAQVVKMFLHQNAMDFLQTYFTDAYRGTKIKP